MSDRLLPAIETAGLIGGVGLTMQQPDWERELAAALVDIARRPGRHASADPAIAPAPTHPVVLDGKEVLTADSYGTGHDDARVPARATVHEIDPDPDSRKDLTS